MIKISISVVCYDSPANQLRALTGSILASVEFMRERLEIDPIPLYVIDNSELVTVSFATIKEFQSDFDELLIQPKLISGHGNIGYGGAHNLVLDKIESDFHLILNPDVTLERDALHKSVELLLSNTKRKMLGPSALGIKGERQYLCKRYPTVATLFLRGFIAEQLRRIFAKRLDAYEMRDLPDDRVTDDIPLLSGCFMLLDTPTFRKVKGFDERYFLYFEDFDLSLRVKKFGTLAYAPMVRINHAGGKTSTKGLWHIMMFLSSAVKFFSIHCWRVF